MVDGIQNLRAFEWDLESLGVHWCNCINFKNSVNHHHIHIGFVDETGVSSETCCGATFQGCPFGFRYCFTEHPILFSYIKAELNVFITSKINWTPKVSKQMFMIWKQMFMIWWNKVLIIVTYSNKPLLLISD